MTTTLKQGQAELPRLVEIASQGEDVVITVEGKPKARLTRADAARKDGTAAESPKDILVRLRELEELRRKYSTGKTGPTVDQILEENRADRI